MRNVLILIIAAIAAAPAAQAYEAGPFTLGGEIKIGSEGISKGISETEGNAQIVGAVTAGYKPFFAGVRLKNVKGTDGADGQTQWFVGARDDIAGFKVGLQVLYKTNNNARRGTDDDFYEWQSDISRTFNKSTTVKYTAIYSPDASGVAEEGWWHDLSVAQKLNDRWSVSGGAGVRKLTKARDYNGYNLGATYAVSQKTGLDLRYYDTDKPEYGKRYGDRLVLALSQKF